MALPALHATITSLNQAAQKHDACLVELSGSPDSLVVLDLCSRTFRRVACFHMHLVPGLQVSERTLAYAQKRWGVQIFQYPHWRLTRYIQAGTYTPRSLSVEDLPDVEASDIQKVARKDSGITLLADGTKRCDGRWKRQSQAVPPRDLIQPVYEWKRLEVMAYMKRHDIAVPDMRKGSAFGVDLSTPCLLWLYEEHPKDFQKICERFPYAEAAVWHRRFYGTGKKPVLSQRGGVDQPQSDHQRPVQPAEDQRRGEAEA